MYGFEDFQELKFSHNKCNDSKAFFFVQKCQLFTLRVKKLPSCPKLWIGSIFDNSGESKNMCYGRREKSK